MISSFQRNPEKGLAPLVRGQRTRKVYYKYLKNDQNCVINYRNKVVHHINICMTKSLQYPCMT